MAVDLCRLRYFVSQTILPGKRNMLIFSRSEFDQTLDELSVGPVPVGVNKFVFEADSPKLNRIPNNEILGVTVILLSCSYDGREFVRVGYYVNNEYNDEALNADPPAKPIVEKVRRNILAEKPRVTRFAIKWYASTSYLHREPKLTDTSTGTPKSLLHQSSRPISRKPMRPKTMAPHTALRRKKRSSPKKLQLLHL